MSTSHTGEGSEASGTAGANSKVRRASRRNTIAEGTVTQVSENHEIISGFGLPFLARPRKGRLNVSEASIPAPQSSDISAQGQVFVPPHEYPGKQGAPALHSHSKKTDEETRDTAAAANPSTKPLDDPGSQTQTEAAVDIVFAGDVGPQSTEDESEAVTATSGCTRPASHLFTQSESALEVIAESFAKFGPPQPRSIPEIRVHRPSGTVMAASLGTTAMSSANVPATPTQTAVSQSPAAFANTPLSTVINADTAAQMPAGLPIDPSAITNGINTLASAVPLPSVGLPIRGKVGKRKKIIRKARKIVVRKRLLAIIIGRDLAKVVHSQLNTVGNLVDNIPLPVDGPSDLIHGYARRTERKKDIQRRQLDQKIASARIHAEAEEVHRCRICRGLTRTSYLRRYHRLQLKRDRPDMGMLDRGATAMARVAAFKCKCNRRLLGVENEAAAKDATAQQHQRAPAAIEAPLSGVDGALAH